MQVSHIPYKNSSGHYISGYDVAEEQGPLGMISTKKSLDSSQRFNKSSEKPDFNNPYKLGAWKGYG